jgi:hypothetical protein
MSLRPSWLRSVKDGISAAFYAQYRRYLNINEHVLLDYIRTNGFETPEAVLAHFKRAISYYAEKYAIIPTLNHLTSPKIPALVDIPDWEKALYSTYPQFCAQLISPSENKLDSETKGYSGLFPSYDVVDLFLNFARTVNEEDRIKKYTESALIVIERLIFSMAYKKYGKRGDFLSAIEAQMKLVLLRKSLIAQGIDVRSKVEHWSTVLVPEQEIQVFGKTLNFWELPKTVVNKDFSSVYFGIYKFGGQHARTCLDLMVEFSEGKLKYLPFLLTARQEFVLDSVEKDLWKDSAPSQFCPYPY